MDMMIEIDKKGIQAICYVSEAALSVATSVFKWTVPAASLFGVPMKYIDESCKKSTLEEEYVDAVNRALSATKKTFKNSYSKLQILEELSEQTGELDVGLSEVITKTEAYRISYATRMDAKEIIVEFERNFKNEITEHSILSNYYILRTSETTLDILKKAKILIEADSAKINSIYSSVNAINQDSRKIGAFLSRIAKIMTSGSIMFCIFMISSTFMNFQYSFGTLLYTFIAITVSEWLICYLPLEGNDFGTQIKLAIIQVIVAAAFLFFFISRTSNIENLEILFVTMGTAVDVVIKKALLYFK